MINQKVLFNTIFEQRRFIESLTDNDIKYYYKGFKLFYKLRRRENILCKLKCLNII